MLTVDEFARQASEWIAVNRQDAPPDWGAIMPPEAREAGMAWQRRLHDAGFGAIHWPTQYGGRGLTIDHHRAWAEACQSAGVPSILNMVGLVLTAGALLRFGTDEQKQRWLPAIASGETLCAVAVTEPDFGSDVANLKVSASPEEGGWRINGVKTWCTFAARADVMMVLARTEADRTLGHRGLSILIVEKERGDSHGFELSQDGGGTMEGRPIDTIGYRGMHSYEVAFDNWFVPAENLIGMDEGRGRGFYYQMAGFENGRIQTAARAVGVMQAAYESAKEYAENRVVFGQPIAEYQLTRVKLTRMAAIIQASRQFSYQVGRMMAKGEGKMEASMIKAFVCKASEWVTREAMQIHGGMGYAEEYDVSRYFLDARVLSIFEGADETLTLKVITRTLVKNAQASS